MRADADPAFAVVAALGRLFGPAGAVVGGGEVARGVVGVVVVVEEVPAGDVVDEAVAVAVDAVAEGGDQVLGVELAGTPCGAGVRVDASSRRSRRR